jgi:hypothetical protein
MTFCGLDMSKFIVSTLIAPASSGIRGGTTSAEEGHVAARGTLQSSPQHEG